MLALCAGATLAVMTTDDVKGLRLLREELSGSSGSERVGRSIREWSSCALPDRAQRGNAGAEQIERTHGTGGVRAGDHACRKGPG